MVTQTTSVPLGTQLATFNAFCNATSPVSDYAAVIETWNAMRRLVLPQNGVPIDAFGGLPTHDKMVEFFSIKVHGTLFQVLGRRVEELARGIVSKEVCEHHRVSPEEITQYGAMGLLPLSAVQAFNTSAAEYLSRRFDERGVKLGYVINGAVQYLKHGHCSEKDLDGFIDAVENGSDDVLEVGPEIERSLRLLVHYGPGRTSSFFQKHSLNAEILDRAIEYGLVSEQSAMELCNACASSLHKIRRHQRVMHRLGIVGVIPSGYLLGAFLMSRGLNLRSMIYIFVQNPFVTIPLSLCVIIFGLMTWRPDLFIRD
jgi:hypothetical protein